MSRLKIIDRIAISSMLMAVVAIPLAASAFSLESGSMPAARVPLENGAQRQFFTSGPFGTTTYRVDVSPSGQVVARTQVLTDDVFRSIRAGMPASEAFTLIGPPHSKMRFESTHVTAWDYHYRDTWGYTSEFSVMVDEEGIVAGTFRVREGE
ncbi:MAG TPA: hypothetical protein VFP36_03585 [Usitatibacter sp.]|nr:hypothetical protein [Usitatibacter sp.]